MKMPGTQFKMRTNVFVTCGPSYEPIDEVRRITNFSTGELGVMLANRLAREGIEVTCFKGAAATTQVPLIEAKMVSFTTSASLCDLLRKAANPENISAIFHTAALCDFKVKAVSDARGADASSRKISSRKGELHLTLEPAEKVISRLRALFPQSLIVGWKYELSGTREDALAQGRTQMITNQTDACVVNGAAYGDGFGFLEKSDAPQHVPDKQVLCEFLLNWLRGSVILF